MRRSRRRKLLTLAVLLAPLGSRGAAQQFRGEPDDFLQAGVGARALGMGGAFSALADDVTASVYNPAGLGLLQSNEVQLMHAPLYYSTDLDYLGMAFPLTPSLTFGMSGVLLRTSGIEQTNSFNQVTGANQSVYSAAYVFSAATRIRKFQVGASAKMFSQSLLGHSGSALGADLGVIYPATPWLRTSFVVQNLNEPTLKLIDAPDVYRTHFVAGAAVLVPGNRLTITAEYRSNQSGTGNVLAGGEVTVAKNFYARAGIDRQSLPALGFGLRWTPMQFDYAFSQNPLGGLHRFSFTYRFGQLFRVRVRPEYEGGEGAVVLGPATTQITFKVERPKFPIEWWKMAIYNLDGAPLKEIEGMGPPPGVFWWDLRDTLGRPIHAGDYPFEFSVKYQGGNVWSEKGEIRTVNQFQEEPVQMKLKLPGNP